MHIHRYILLANEPQATDLIRQIDESRGSDHWGEPNVNPFDGRALVPWNDEYLAGQAHLIEGKNSVSRDQAQDQGWAFGYFRGKFAKARIKLEEAQQARAVLNIFDHSPNYPAFRALFFSLLSALYGVKEALSKATTRLGKDGKNWWSLKFREISDDPLLKLLYDLNNADKHSISTPILRPGINFYRYEGGVPPGTIISAEGMFFPVEVGTARERRVFLEGVDATFEVFFEVESLRHKGQDVSKMKVNEMLDLVLTYYEDLIFEARVTFDNGT